MKLINKIGKDQYYLLLSIQLAFILVLSLIPIGDQISETIIGVGLSLVLLASANTLGANRKVIKKLSIGLAVIFILLTIVSEFSTIPNIYFITFFVFLTLMSIVVGDIILMLIFTKEIKVSNHITIICT